MGPPGVQGAPGVSLPEEAYLEMRRTISDAQREEERKLAILRQRIRFWAKMVTACLFMLGLIIFLTACTHATPNMAEHCSPGCEMSKAQERARKTDAARSKKYGGHGICNPKDCGKVRQR